MIKFSLQCERDHAFEGWFRNNDDFDTQSKRGFVECPHCGSTKIGKALMAPAVSTARKKNQIAVAMGAEQRAVLDQLREMSKKVRETSENVGSRFVEEARKIHFGETEARGIYGEASPEEARALVEDGVEFAPLPIFPEDRN